MEYITVRQAAENWGISERRVQKLCEEGRIPKVQRPSRDWLIPKNAKKPVDRRVKSGRYVKKKEGEADGEGA